MIFRQTDRDTDTQVSKWTDGQKKQIDRQTVAIKQGERERRKERRKIKTKTKHKTKEKQKK